MRETLREEAKQSEDWKIQTVKWAIDRGQQRIAREKTKQRLTMSREELKMSFVPPMLLDTFEEVARKIDWWEYEQPDHDNNDRFLIYDSFLPPGLLTLYERIENILDEWTIVMNEEIMNEDVIKPFRDMVSRDRADRETMYRNEYDEDEIERKWKETREKIRTTRTSNKDASLIIRTEISWLTKEKERKWIKAVRKERKRIVEGRNRWKAQSQSTTRISASERVTNSDANFDRDNPSLLSNVLPPSSELKSLPLSNVLPPSSELKSLPVSNNKNNNNIKSPPSSESVINYDANFDRDNPAVKLSSVHSTKPPSLTSLKRSPSASSGRIASTTLLLSNKASPLSNININIINSNNIVLNNNNNSNNNNNKVSTITNAVITGRTVNVEESKIPGTTHIICTTKYDATLPRPKISFAHEEARSEYAATENHVTETPSTRSKISIAHEAPSELSSARPHISIAHESKHTEIEDKYAKENQSSFYDSPRSKISIAHESKWVSFSDLLYYLNNMYSLSLTLIKNNNSETLSYINNIKTVLTHHAWSSSSFFCSTYRL
jgi:hypothetical protein